MEVARQPEYVQAIIPRGSERWGALPVDDLHERGIDDWCEDRNAAGLSNATLKAERQVLRVLLRWARDRCAEVRKNRSRGKSPPIVSRAR